MTYMPAAEKITAVQNKVYDSVSGAALHVNTDTEEKVYENEMTILLAM